MIKGDDEFFHTSSLMSSINPSSEQEESEEDNDEIDLLQDRVDFHNKISHEMHDPFASLRRLSHSKLKKHQRICALLTAVEEMIKEKNMPLSESAYFAMLMSVLEQQKYLHDPDHLLEATLLLLSKVMPKVNADVLKVKYTFTMELLLHFMKEKADHVSLIRSSMICITTLLKAADTTMWSVSGSGTHPIWVFRKQLFLIIDIRPKIRKAAQQHIGEILATPWSLTERHPSIRITGKFMIKVLSHKDKMGLPAILHTLTFLSHVIHFMYWKHIEKILESFKMLLLMKDVHVSAAVFKSLYHLFLLSLEPWSAPKLMQVLNFFYKAQPDRNDLELSVPWLAMIGAGYIKMAQLDETICMKKLPTVIHSVMEMMLSDQKEIRMAAVSTLNNSICNCISQEMIAITEKAVLTASMECRDQSDKTSLEQIIAIILKGLSYKYRDSWDAILSLIMQLFGRLGARSDPIMKDAVDLLGNLYNLSEFPFKDEVKNCLGIAISTMGPKAFLDILPLNLMLQEG
jgi:ribosomal RNA-processing protein 12